MTFLEKVKQLPEPIAAFFLSDSQRHELEKGCFRYGIDDDNDIGKIAIKLGQLYIGELKLKDLPVAINKETNLGQKVCYGLSFEINKRIFNKFPDYYTDSSELLAQWERLKSAPLISEDEAWKKVLEAEPWIMDNEKEEADTKKQTAVEQKKTDSLSITEALQKYPKLGEQNVSSNPLKLRYFATLVRPSIKNWITDFHDNMGAGKHGSIDRGNYLFHSDNGKKLTPLERQKLSEMFKSLDEQTPLNIEIEAQMIVFESGAEKGRSSVGSSQAAVESQDIFQRYATRSPQPQARSYSPPNFAAKPVPQPTPQLVRPEAQFANDNYFSNFVGSQIEQKQPDKKMSDPNPADLSGSVSFSSSQKLPVEQSPIPTKIVPRPLPPQKPVPLQPQPRQTSPLQQVPPQIKIQPQPQPQPQPEKIVRPQAQPAARQSQWHIAPTGYDYGKKDTQPKVDKNIVDLRH